MTEKLLCPHLLAFRDPTARDPNAGCYCLQNRCAVWRWMPLGGTNLRREGYCGLAERPENGDRQYAYRPASKDRRLTIVSESEQV